MTMTARLPKETLPDAEIQRKLGLQAASEVLGAVGEGVSIELGPLTTNYYSFTFSVKIKTDSGLRELFVKIPKADTRGRAAGILPITAEERRMAQDEADSLRLLGQNWNGEDLEVRWVKLCGTIPECNALVTDRVFADEAVSVFRRFDLRRRLGFRRDSRRLQSSMSRLGTVLGRFHRTGAKPAVFRLSEMLPKFEFYCRELTRRAGSVWPDRILEKLKSMGDLELASIEAPTLKGLDIRNVLIDAQDHMYLLDPGKTKFTFPEADLARFVMTYRILHWGSKCLVLVGEPDRRAEAAFLESYYSNSQPPRPQLLSLFLLKEQLKHWHTALDSLDRRAWPGGVKRLAAAIYVNPFYTRQVAAQFRSIGRE